MLSICQSFMFTTEGSKHYCYFENKARVQTIVIAMLLVWVSSIYTYAVTEFVFHILFLCSVASSHEAYSAKAHETLAL